MARPLINFLILLSLIWLNIWLFQRDCGYSVNTVSAKLQKTKLQPKETRELYLLNRNLDWISESVALEDQSTSGLPELIWLEIKNRQQSLFPFIQKNCDLVHIFETEDGPVLFFEATELMKLSLVEAHLMHQLIHKNFCPLYPEKSLRCFFRTGTGRDTRYLFNDTSLGT
ncbi:MAG: hypothetical protein PHQ23_05990 [Candidatus Wallbacteria bacterium]|nr:hypothetical protein [Candidatus Wallbacteria bacterium]